MAKIEGIPWLTDVAFGGNCPIEPLPILIDQEFDQGLDLYRFKLDSSYGYQLQHYLNPDWRTLYAFTLEESFAPDFAMLNYWTANCPDSLFVQQRRCVLPSLDARKILTNYEFKIRRKNGDSEVRTIRNEEEYCQVLRTHFNLEINLTDLIRIPIDLPRKTP